MASYRHVDEGTDVVLSAGLLLSFTLGMATPQTKTLCLQERALSALILIFFPKSLYLLKLCVAFPYTELQSTWLVFQASALASDTWKAPKSLDLQQV